MYSAKKIKAFMDQISFTDTCWLWNGKTRKGSEKHRSLPYGEFNLCKGIRTVHRVAYTLFCGDIPSGAFVCHKCDNILCVNPLHLYIGDVKSNSKDKRGKHYKVSETMKQKILELRKQGESYANIAKEVGVCKSTPWRICNGHHDNPIEYVNVPSVGSPAQRKEEGNWYYS